MNIDKLLEQIRAERCAAFVYEKAPAGPSSFRDRVIFYCDGKARFERYCQGEAAGKVCELSADSIDEQGAISWNYDACAYGKKDEAPKKLTGAGSGGLVFDGKTPLWKRAESLRRDPEHGYGFLRMLLLRLRGQ